MVIMLAVTCTGPKQVATADQVWSAIEQAGYQPVDATDLYRDDMPGLVQCIAFEKDGEYFTFYLKTEDSAMLIWLGICTVFFVWSIHDFFKFYTKKQTAKVCSLRGNKQKSNFCQDRCGWKHEENGIYPAGKSWGRKPYHWQERRWRHYILVCRNNGSYVGLCRFCAFYFTLLCQYFI